MLQILAAKGPPIRIARPISRNYPGGGTVALPWEATQASASAGAGMLQAVLIALIRVYQMTLSRLLFAAFGPVCRFEPSCSRYALACIEGQGALRGSLLSVKRLCKCHPFHPGGHDPPPPPRPGSRAFLRERSNAQSQRAPLMPSTPGDSAPLAGPDQLPGASAQRGPH